MTGYSIAAAYYGKPIRTKGRENFYAYVKRHDVEIEKMSDESISRIVSEVNRMVKSESCPKNLMNRFYKWKHRYLRERINRGEVEKVLESENYYHFFFNDGSDFHQLKTTFPNGIENISGHEEYINEDKNAPLDVNYH